MNKYLKILLTTSIFLAIPSITLAKENMNKRELPKEVKECMVDFKPRTAEFDNCLKDKGFEPKKHFKERHGKRELPKEVKECMVDFKPRTAEFDNCLKDKGFEPKKYFKERHGKRELPKEVKE